MKKTQKTAPELDLRPLYKWYKKNRRDLPFRRTQNPYRVWVSETMLQQTRIAAVLKAYENFLERFPNIQSLAKTSEDEVLAFWQGLGYYSRARNLYKGACQVVQMHNGIFPKNLSAALKIPGVGPYTAAAVLSISYCQPLAVLDANVKRILARMYHIRQAAKKGQLERLAHSWMEQRTGVSPGEHNQAVMEWGEVICTAKQPKCPLCPLHRQCRSCQKGGAEEAGKIPLVRKKNFIELELRLWLIMSPNKTHILLLKERHSRFLKNLWFLPYAYEGHVPFLPKAAPHFPNILSQLPIQKTHLFSQKIKHSITNHKITACVEAVWLQSKQKELLQALHAQTETKDVQWLWAKYTKTSLYLVSSLGYKAVALLTA